MNPAVVGVAIALGERVDAGGVLDVQQSCIADVDRRPVGQAFEGEGLGLAPGLPAVRVLVVLGRQPQADGLEVAVLLVGPRGIEREGGGAVVVENHGFTYHRTYKPAPTRL